MIVKHLIFTNLSQISLSFVEATKKYGSNIYQELGILKIGPIDFYWDNHNLSRFPTIMCITQKQNILKYTCIL
jgi:hypothetical protein